MDSNFDPNYVIAEAFMGMVAIKLQIEGHDVVTEVEDGRVIKGTVYWNHPFIPLVRFSTPGNIENAATTILLDLEPGDIVRLSNNIGRNRVAGGNFILTAERYSDHVRRRTGSSTSSRRRNKFCGGGTWSGR